MDRNELIFIGASILLSGRIAQRGLDNADMNTVVGQAKQLHDEVEKQCAPSKTLGVVELGKRLEGKT